MKKSIIIVFIFLGFLTNAQLKKTKLKSQIVAVSCGECQFKMEGQGCDLAVRIDGKDYFIDGTSIDSYGDAHATDGFCLKVRKAEVTGMILNNRFKVNSFTLLPEEKEEKK